MDQWRFSLNTEKLTATMRIAERVCALAEEQNNPPLMIGAYHISATCLTKPWGSRNPWRRRVLAIRPSG
jgi:hypothetical protein